MISADNKQDQVVSAYSSFPAVNTKSIFASEKLKYIETALQQKLNLTYTSRAKQTSPVTRFIDWCKNQEENRFGWVAASIAVHGCFLTPLTVLALMFTGNSMLLWALAIGAMGIVLISNLTAMPTKITIPVLLLSILIDLTIIIYSLTGILVI